MKTAPQNQAPERPVAPVVALSEDIGFWKDVYFPDCLVGETPAAAQLRQAFTAAGYEVKKIERDSIHPVWTIIANLGTAPRFAVPRQFNRHIRQVIRAAGFPVKPDEMNAQKSLAGVRVHFAEPEACIRYHNWYWNEGWNGDLTEFTVDP